jgi:hypothetical protein
MSTPFGELLGGGVANPSIPARHDANLQSRHTTWDQGLHAGAMNACRTAFCPASLELLWRLLRS